MKEAANPAIAALARVQLNIDTTGWRVLHCRAVRRCPAGTASPPHADLAGSGHLYLPGPIYLGPGPGLPAVDAQREPVRGPLVRPGASDHHHDVVRVAALDGGHAVHAAAGGVALALLPPLLAPVQVVAVGGGPDDVLHAHAAQRMRGVVAHRPQDHLRAGLAVRPGRFGVTVGDIQAQDLGVEA